MYHIGRDGESNLKYDLSAVEGYAQILRWSILLYADIFLMQ